MKKFFTRAAVAAIAVAGIAGAVSTPTAGAVSTDQYDRVRYVMCGNDDVTIDMQNVYGNSEQFTKNLSGSKCAYYDFTESGEYGGFVAVSVVDENGGPVSCKIYVNGQVVSKSNDSSDYYSYASCY
ncbi:hypothetical protein [Gordonia sp. (in: high G+C Gram-positive bacteria)]|jgi:hypothetical protein|uniref:hypothetical protein n=1 Tax=Gordonia sp. (in: high G+C Gram-positive bacteria) TaxID=84139 RepID=UPI001DFED62E|nr:hypothetical protein [Gordonia sp. (in: high G+C Gram-positive bacteria)]MCB1295602.1 hypothetical protein [Gordonia sp. (in: high G+C Gram-positive bacteria)]HMS75837.1 hypothetical protein [Gordonia sp. (in: high G+C Gram-positive bacteria)]HQV20213.1 hypothetical protein [Gordonia sp. (in: high G+C Gram-positive bacteria)]